jgi:hypothetical protein
MRAKGRAITGGAARSSGGVALRRLARGGIGTNGRCAVATAGIGKSRRLGAGRVGSRAAENLDKRSVNAGRKRCHGWLGRAHHLQLPLRPAVARGPAAGGEALPSTLDQPATRPGCLLAALEAKGNS